VDKVTVYAAVAICSKWCGEHWPIGPVPVREIGHGAFGAGKRAFLGLREGDLQHRAMPAGIGREVLGAKAADHLEGMREAAGRHRIGQARRDGGIRHRLMHGALRVTRLARRLLIGETLHRNRRRAIGKTRDHARHDERDETRIIDLAKTTPLRVFLALEDFGEITRLGNLRPVAEAEHAAPAAEMKGTKPAAATLEISRSVSTSSGCAVHS
jgi:hypothetical protein